MSKKLLAASVAVIGLMVGVPAVAQTDSALMWEAPELQNPITIELGKGRSSHTLRAGQDYIVVFPKDAQKVGSTTLLGGDDIVIVGGSATIPANDSTKRALYIKDATGTVHIEGFEVTCTPGAESDAIAVNAPEAVVQIQNSRLCARGTQNGFHGDIFQPWGGVKEYRIDRLTGFSGYQGLQVPIDLGPIGRGTISRTDLHSIDRQIPLGTRPTGGNGRYLLWFLKDCSKSYPVTLNEVYIEGRPERNRELLVWPDSRDDRCASVISGDTVTFPKVTDISGFATIGKPLVEFVPLGVAGLNYKGGVEPVKVETPPPPIVEEETPPPPVVEATVITIKAGQTLIIRGE